MSLWCPASALTINRHVSSFFGPTSDQTSPDLFPDTRTRAELSAQKHIDLKEAGPQPSQDQPVSQFSGSPIMVDLFKPAFERYSPKDKESFSCVPHVLYLPILD